MPAPGVFLAMVPTSPRRAATAAGLLSLAAGLLAAAALAAGAAATAQTAAPGRVGAGRIAIEAPWVRATPQGARTAAGYLRITNTGNEPDRLLGGSSPVAASVEVHEMATTGGVMRMRKVEGGLEIAPGQTVELAPGSGHHLMFTGLREGIRQGKAISGTLDFEKAGKVEVEYAVAPIGAQSSGHSQH